MSERELGTEVALDGTCRVSARGSRRKLQQVEALVRSVEPIQRFSLGGSRRDDIRHAARESLGLCHLYNGMAILCGDSAGRFRFAKKRKTARRRAPSPANNRRKKSGFIGEEGHCSRIRPRVA